MPLAEKVRHTHARHALGRGTELTAVRDNLRHSDEAKRVRQIGDAFLTGK